MLRITPTPVPSYRKKITGNIVFRYYVKSDLIDAKKAEAEVTAYKTKQGTQLKIDEPTKLPLFFGTTAYDAGSALEPPFDMNDPQSNYGVRVDLAAVAARKADLKEKQLARLEAQLQFSGLKREVFTARMFED